MWNPLILIAVGIVFLSGIIIWGACMAAGRSDRQTTQLYIKSIQEKIRANYNPLTELQMSPNKKKIPFKSYLETIMGMTMDCMLGNLDRKTYLGNLRTMLKMMDERFSTKTEAANEQG